MPLYPVGVTPATVIRSPTARLWFDVVVRVAVVPVPDAAVVAPPTAVVSGVVEPV